MPESDPTQTSRGLTDDPDIWFYSCPGRYGFGYHCAIPPFKGIGGLCPVQKLEGQAQAPQNIWCRSELQANRGGHTM